jgi:putative addiction module killer protein
MDQPFELRHYATATGKVVFTEWLESLNDKQAQARIAARIDRLVGGNFGDCKPVGEGVSELRIDYGPGYRVYLATIGLASVLLRCGGDKKRQSADIARAIEYGKEYKLRRGTK